MQPNLFKNNINNITQQILFSYGCILFQHFCRITHLVHPGFMVSHVPLVFELVLTMATRKLLLGMHLTYVPLHVCCLIEILFTVATGEWLFSSVSAHVQVQPPFH